MRCERNEAAGFTLIELVVVMGLLTIFAAFLVQLMGTSVGLFQQGERGQDLADRADAAARAVEQPIQDMLGPAATDGGGRGAGTRMLVQWVPAVDGNATSTAATIAAPRVQVLRAAVRIDERTEERLLRPVLFAEAKATAEGKTQADIEERLRQLVAEAPRAGRASMVLVARPAGDPEAAFFSVRRLLQLPGQRLPIDRRRDVDVMEVVEVGGQDLPWAVYDQASESIAEDVIHLEFALWSQFTRGWDQRIGDGGPEYSWDSARGGWFGESNDPREMFALDVGPQSLDDPTDDVFPRWVKITLVVAAPVGSEAILAGELRAGDRNVDVIDESLLPDPKDMPFVKIGREWVRVGTLGGRSLRGLVRGQRGTKPLDHAAGTRVRVGRTVELFVRVAHGKDSWNGD
ncbi:MAG: prepilin-type N-terminal cleavage/methylation domain-containing protein [Planctomycetota bacterium]